MLFLFKHPSSTPKIENFRVKRSRNFWKYCLEKSGKTHLPRLYNHDNNVCENKCAKYTPPTSIPKRPRDLSPAQYGYTSPLYTRRSSRTSCLAIRGEFSKVNRTRASEGYSEVMAALGWTVPEWAQSFRNLRQLATPTKMECYCDVRFNLVAGLNRMFMKFSRQLALDFDGAY